MPSCKVALIQQPPVYLNLAASLDKLERLAEEAAGERARLIVFPETWLTGYPVWIDSAPNAAIWNHPPAKALFQTLYDNALTIPGAEFDRLRHIARRTTCGLVVGAHEREGGTLYNSQIFIAGDGDTFKVHRKLVPTYTERMIWGRGDGSGLHSLDTDYGVVGGLICWEHWMPLARAAMHAEKETIHVAQWPTAHDLHQLCSRQYAFEGQCFVLASGCTMTRGDVLSGFDSLDLQDTSGRELLEQIPGEDDSFVLNGGSAVIAPDTSYIVEPVFGSKTTVYAELDLTLPGKGNLLLDTDGHYSRPDVFTLTVNRKIQRNVE